MPAAGAGGVSIVVRRRRPAGMGKAKKSKTSPTRKPIDPERRARMTRVAMHLSFVLLFASVCVAAFVLSRQYVEREIATTRGPFIVVVKNRPRWMTDLLVRHFG